MSFLTPAEKSTMRRALAKSGFGRTRNLSDIELQTAYDKLKAEPAPAPYKMPEGFGEGFGPEWSPDALKEKLTPKTPPTPPLPPQKEKAPMPQAPAATPDQSEIIAQLAKLLTPQQAPAPAIDEKQLIALIHKHATTTLEIPAKEAKEPIKIEGAHHALPELVTWLSTGTNVYLTGPAGSGKTTLAEQAAKALDIPFYSTGAIMASYELLGVRNAHGEYIATPLRTAYEKGGVFLLDEVDGCSPKALICFNQLLANDCFSFPDGMVKKHKNFVAVGGANTTGQGATRQYIGRAQLDAATLDRFVQIEIDYDEQLERRIAKAEFTAHGGKDDKLPKLDKWLATVTKARAQLLNMGATALVTPRASLFGARGLARGLDINTLTTQIITKHLSEDQRKQLSL